MGNAPSVSAASSSRDSLGCSLSRLADDRRIDARGMTFHRKKAASAPPEPIYTPATSRGYLLGLSFTGGHRRRIFRAHHSTVHDFAENAVYLRSFQDAYQAELSARSISLSWKSVPARSSAWPIARTLRASANCRLSGKSPIRSWAA